MNSPRLLAARHDLESFGSQLFARRQRLALSQSDVARRAQISAGYYSELENSKRPAPPRSTALRIAAALELTELETEALASSAVEERWEGEHQTRLPLKVRQLVATIRSVAPLLPADFVDSLHAKIKEACM
jgi:transcriptional regulator with XRE-family HTH domain